MSAWILAMFCVSVLLLLLINFCWIETLGTWKYGHKVEELMTSFLMAFITGCVFYALVTIQTQRRLEKTMFGSIYQLSELIVLHGRELVQNVLSLIDYEPSSKDILQLTPDILEKNFNNGEINFEKESKTYDGKSGKYYSCIEMVEKSREQIKSYIGKIVPFSPVLNVEYIRLIRQLDDNRLWIYVRNKKRIREIKTPSGMTFENNPKNFFSEEIEQFWEFKDIVKKIDEFNKKHNK